MERLKENNIYLGDAYELIKSVPDNSVDMILTSPPYDNMRAYDPMPFGKFQELAREMKRVMKDGSVLVWIVSDQTIGGGGIAHFVQTGDILSGDRHEGKRHNDLGKAEFQCRRRHSIPLSAGI